MAKKKKGRKKTSTSQKRQLQKNEPNLFKQEQQRKRLRIEQLSDKIAFTGLFAMLIVFPLHNYLGYVVWFPIVMPLIAFGVFVYFRAIIMKHHKNRSPINLAIALGFSSVGLVVIAIFKFDVVYFGYLFYYVTLAAIVFTLLILKLGNILHPKKKITYRLISVYFILLMIYFSSSTILLNCVYDSSEPVLYSVKVLNKEIEDRKRTNYYLTLAPWGIVSDTTREGVSKSMYRKLNIGSEIQIVYQEGIFGIPWKELTLY